MRGTTVTALLTVISAVPAAPAVAALPALPAAGDPPERTRHLEYDAQRGEWVEVLPPPPDTPERELHDVRVLIAEEAYRKAIRRIERFVREYGESTTMPRRCSRRFFPSLRAWP